MYIFNAQVLFLIRQSTGFPTRVWAKEGEPCPPTGI